jgi:hypothetical protein
MRYAEFPAFVRAFREQRLFSRFGTKRPQFPPSPRPGSLCLVIAAFMVSQLASTTAANIGTIAVDLPALIFSSGNWTGDEERGGKVFRQTWNSGAYFRVTVVTRNSALTATPVGYLDVPSGIQSSFHRLQHRRGLAAQSSVRV